MDASQIHRSGAVHHLGLHVTGKRKYQYCSPVDGKFPLQVCDLRARFIISTDDFAGWEVCVDQKPNAMERITKLTRFSIGLALWLTSPRNWKGGFPLLLESQSVH